VSVEGKFHIADGMANHAVLVECPYFGALSPKCQGENTFRVAISSKGEPILGKDMRGYGLCLVAYAMNNASELSLEGGHASYTQVRVRSGRDERVFSHSRILNLRLNALKLHHFWTFNIKGSVDARFNERQAKLDGGRAMKMKAWTRKKLYASIVDLQSTMCIDHEINAIESKPPSLLDHTCCVCQPQLVPRIRPGNRIDEGVKISQPPRPYTLTEIAAGKSVGPFLIVCRVLGHSKDGIAGRMIPKKRKSKPTTAKTESSTVIPGVGVMMADLPIPDPGAMATKVLYDKFFCERIYNYLATPWSEMRDAYTHTTEVMQKPISPSGKPVKMITKTIFNHCWHPDGAMEAITDPDKEGKDYCKSYTRIKSSYHYKIVVNPVNHADWIAGTPRCGAPWMKSYWSAADASGVEFDSVREITSITPKDIRYLPHLNQWREEDELAKRRGAQRFARPMWWGLLYVVHLKRHPSVLGRLVAVTKGTILLSFDDVSSAMHARKEPFYPWKGGPIVKNERSINICEIQGQPELICEHDDVLRLYPTTHIPRLSDLQDLCSHSRYVGRILRKELMQLYRVEQLDKKPHPDPYLSDDTLYPCSPMGYHFAKCAAVPKYVKRITDPKSMAPKCPRGYKAKPVFEIQYEALKGYRPKFAWDTFIQHDMCLGARNRFEVRRFLARVMCGGQWTRMHDASKLKKTHFPAERKKVGSTKFYTWTARSKKPYVKHKGEVTGSRLRPFFGFHSQSDRTGLYRILLPRLVDFLCVKSDDAGGTFSELTDFSLEGVSEKTFNDVYFLSLAMHADVPFNDLFQVNHILFVARGYLPPPLLPLFPSHPQHHFYDCPPPLHYHHHPSPPPPPLPDQPL
jgi:hypothetical protein